MDKIQAVKISGNKNLHLNLWCPLETIEDKAELKKIFRRRKTDFLLEIINEEEGVLDLSIQKYWILALLSLEFSFNHPWDCIDVIDDVYSFKTFFDQQVFGFLGKVLIDFKIEGSIFFEMLQGEGWNIVVK